MDAREPRVRRRGFFLHSSDGDEPDTGEHENPEGFAVRVRIPGHSEAASVHQRPSARRRAIRRPIAPNRSHRTEDRPAIRSGSVTGSRQRAHLPR